MIKLKTIPPPKPQPIYRASVHKTGKIGLTIETARHFGFTTDKAVELAINDGDPNDKNIYAIMKRANEDNTYKILKAGDYHSINANLFFDSIGVDYSRGNIQYQVSEIEVDGMKVLKFEKFEKDKASKNEMELF